jgi:hypothetical protein
MKKKKILLCFVPVVFLFETEINRTPFDFTEGESDLVSLHVEYGSDGLPHHHARRRLPFTRPITFVIMCYNLINENGKFSSLLRADATIDISIGMKDILNVREHIVEQKI